jgi:hypothetical protein
LSYSLGTESDSETEARREGQKKSGVGTEIFAVSYIVDSYCSLFSSLLSSIFVC